MRNEMVLINFEQTSTDLNGSGSMGLRFKLELLKYHSEHEFDLATTLLSRLKIEKIKILYSIII